MSKFTLGEVIDGLFTGKFKKAQAEVRGETFKQLIDNGGVIHCVTFPGGEVETDIFIPNISDGITKWDVEYDIHYQPLDYLVIRYWKSHGAVNTKETITFTEECFIESRNSLMDKHDFKSFISVVGFLNDRVIVFNGKVEQP